MIAEERMRLSATDVDLQWSATCIVKRMRKNKPNDVGLREICEDRYQWRLGQDQLNVIAITWTEGN